MGKDCGAGGAGTPGQDDVSHGGLRVRDNGILDADAFLQVLYMSIVDA